jgi:transcriptional regulator with XRE-family HTH domain
MSTPLSPSDPYGEFEREYHKDIAEREIFGALLVCVQFRKLFSNLTQTELARRTGKDKTAISHLLKEQSNLTINTIAELANSLDVDFKFAFVDRIDPTRIFTGTGVHYLDGRFAVNQFAAQSHTVAQWGTSSTAKQINETYSISDLRAAKDRPEIMAQQVVSNLVPRQAPANNSVSE